MMAISEVVVGSSRDWGEFMLMKPTIPGNSCYLIQITSRVGIMEPIRGAGGEVG